ncbi:type II secretion system F family protein [Sphingomonas sp. H39-1-10]|uniref:type II secretion system F family protein n=1 Tax=Sphingomonas pollutisoli TaxID=3030829 RepID=UPI0023BA1F36|nr:type II secretion system F family protein [Sphingomonas pollutisoli]MDF0487774.1 type II secretion system F family protein [Sphingomonas pollutisoli]
MATFQYRALKADGSTLLGRVDALDKRAAVASVRRNGATLLDLSPAAPVKERQRKGSAKSRLAAAVTISELAVLLEAGLQLDRALALAIENVEDKTVAMHLAEILREVREGAPLSRAMAQKPELFSQTAVAMTEAGEANGRLGEALTTLAAALEEEAELRRLVISSMIYPIALLVIAVGVVLLMLLFVVPQFESMFASTTQKLPTATVVVMTASRLLRHYGLAMLLLSGVALFGAAVALRQPAVRLARDRIVLSLPQLGELVRRIETARFARTLGALIQGEVALPVALSLAQRTISNQVLGRAIAQVADGVREGGGLTAPLAASGVLPRLAIGFLRTGEETSQLGMMLNRLATVLERDIRTRLERLIGILTPVITVVLGATVAGIIASIMSAILGFNDLALAS